MPDARDMPRDRILFDAIIKAAADKGWDALSLRDVAAEAGLTLSDIHDRLPHRHALMPWLIEQIDLAVLETSARLSLDQSPRDRLFEILMDRFDQLQALRPLLLAMRDRPSANAAPGRVFDLAAGLLCLPRSMSWMLELAGLSTAGVAGLVKSHGLALIHLAALRVWLDDDSLDLGLTMKALDGHLARAERWAGWLPEPKAATLS